jgi:amino-acid N-acetyltransferase
MKVIIAQPMHIDEISKLIEEYANKKILLPKSIDKIRKEINDTLVCIVDSKLVGVVNSVDYGNSLYEIRGLVVKDSFQDQGIGKQLVQGLMQKLKKEHSEEKLTLFALTYVPGFFEVLGFRRVDKENYPKKIFDDCESCAKKNDCLEIAMEMII